MKWWSIISEYVLCRHTLTRRCWWDAGRLSFVVRQRTKRIAFWESKCSFINQPCGFSLDSKICLYLFELNWCFLKTYPLHDQLLYLNNIFLTMTLNDQRLALYERAMRRTSRQYFFFCFLCDRQTNRKSKPSKQTNELSSDSVYVFFSPPAQYLLSSEISLATMAAVVVSINENHQPNWMSVRDHRKDAR